MIILLWWKNFLLIHGIVPVKHITSWIPIAFDTNIIFIYRRHLQVWMMIGPFEWIRMNGFSLVKLILVVGTLHIFGLKRIKITDLNILHKLVYIVTFINRLVSMLHKSVHYCFLIIFNGPISIKVPFPLLAIIDFILLLILWIWRHIINIIGPKIITVDASK